MGLGSWLGNRETDLQVWYLKRFLKKQIEKADTEEERTKIVTEKLGSGNGRAATLEIAAFGILIDTLADVLAAPDFASMVSNPKMLLHVFVAILAVRVAAYLRSIVPIKKDASAAQIGAAVEKVLNEPKSVDSQNAPALVNAVLQDIIKNPVSPNEPTVQRN